MSFSTFFFLSFCLHSEELCYRLVCYSFSCFFFSVQFRTSCSSITKSIISAIAVSTSDELPFYNFSSVRSNNKNRFELSSVFSMLTVIDDSFFIIELVDQIELLVLFALSFLIVIQVLIVRRFFCY